MKIRDVCYQLSVVQSCPGNPADKDIAGKKDFYEFETEPYAKKYKWAGGSCSDRRLSRLI